MPSRSYVMYGTIAAGGMASVRLGRLLGPGGFARKVAIKRLHPELASDPEIAAAFADEACHAACVAHANVAAMLDVVSADGELLLVMEYVHGEALSRLLATARAHESPVPVPVLVAVLADVLHGLHAAHEARDAAGEPLKLVHRDVSPQNVIVGVDGVARLVDFGIAKAMARANLTRDGIFKGKMPYLAPEQLLQRSIDRRVDVYAAGVILHEGLTGKRLFQADDEAGYYDQIVDGPVLPPSHTSPGVPAALDAITMRAIDRHPDRRFATAHEMALALEAAVPHAPASVVADWVATSAREALAKRSALIAEMERDARGSDGAGPSVRGPAASVVFHDVFPMGEVPRPLPQAQDSAVAGGPAPWAREVSPSDPLPPWPPSPFGRQLPRARRTRVALAAAFGVAAVSVAGLAFFALASPPRDAVPGGPASGATPQAPAEPSAVASAMATSLAPAAEGSGSASSVPAPAPAPVTSARSGTGSSHAPAAPARPPAGPRWCKVFDAEKRIYVLKAMRVAQCP